jgi:TolA-binding protein
MSSHRTSLRRSIAVVAVVMATLPGCVLDRRGQSSTARYERDLLMQGARLGSLEQQFDDMDTRLTRVEELTRARGEQDILKLETLEQVRAEVTRIRGEVELLRHEFDTHSADGDRRLEDAAFRIGWLEARAEQLEKSLGLAPPPPPEPPPAEEPTSDPDGEETGTVPAATTDTATTDDSAVTDPEQMLALAKEHLAAGRPQAAESILNRFLKLHSGHDKEAEALYRRAEAAFNQKNYPGAVLRFQEVIDAHKRSVWAAYAMYRQGECFEAQGQRENARLFWEDVIRLWPDTKAAKMAKAKLKK